MSKPHTADLGTRYRYRQEGAEIERQRILHMLTEQVNRLEEMRPPGYKSVAEMADIRITTIRKIIQLIKGEQK